MLGKKEKAKDDSEVKLANGVAIDQKIEDESSLYPEPIKPVVTLKVG